MTEEYHVPVLLNEVISFLKIEKNCWYVDATAGGGGHTKEIINNGGLVLAIDQDEDSLNYLKLKFENEIRAHKLRLVLGNFADLKSISEQNHIYPIKGILFDLGMSTFQIKKSGRGFSFKRNEVLDMRMSKKTELSALNIVNNASEEELYEIFRFFGEENLAQKLAESIFFTRTINPIKTTFDLVNIAKDVYKKAGYYTRLNPATKIFQALRIKVNSELINLKKGLVQAIDLLDNKGRCIVISFHSLEDRIVKQLFKEAEKNKKGICITKKPLISGEEEFRNNPASRSAKMRVFERKYDRI